jgi:hypothetical protein
MAIPTAKRAAPQHAAAFNTLSTHVLERWFDKQKAQDIVFEAAPVLQLLMMLPGVIEKGQYGHDLLVKLMDSKGAGIDSFEYYDTVDTSPTQGSTAARFGFSWYSAPITMSLHEEAEFTSDDAFADRFMQYIEQQELSMADRLADDLYVGNSLVPTNIQGFEQALSPITHLDASGGSATLNERLVNNFQVRQADTTYGGITRVPWTSTADGTGWENNSFDASVATQASFGIAASGAPNDQLQRFHEFYRINTHGVYEPNVIIMSDIPYDDLEFASFQKTEFRRAPGELSGANLSFDHQMFKRAIVVRDERALASGAHGDASAGDQMIYMLNTKTWRFLIDSRFDFSLSEPKTPTHQHASTRFMLFRGQLICNNPRFNGSYFSYPVL